jgi:predicted phage terminase large subunit-like protein
MTEHEDKRRAFAAVCRSDFTTFAQKCFRSLNPGAEFQVNWHIAAMAHHLEEVRLGRIRRLIINAPPRTLKSLLASTAFPAFMLGREPTKRVIAVSYGMELTIKLANDFRAIITAPWYQDLFPGMRISRTKNTESEVVTTQSGYRLATSVDGTLTGRGGDVVIIDDPLKPGDALSDSKRRAVNDWFRNTLISRLDDKQNGAIILVMQRLHDDDLTGAILRASDDWTLLNLPAIAEQDEKIKIGDADQYHIRRVGDVLHAEREPRSVLDWLRAQIGAHTFAAQYQQAPVPPDGVMIKRDWVRRYDHLPAHASFQIFQSWDTASTTSSESDFSVCTTWVIHEKNYYLIDVVRGHFDYPTLRARAITSARACRPSRILIEDSGVGTALVTELKQAGLEAIGVKPEHDKVTRMSIQSGKFESGQIFFPTRAPWLMDLETELFAFPNGRHDDLVDSISQALAHPIEVSGWNATSAKNFGKLMEAFARDQYFGYVTGRPW